MPFTPLHWGIPLLLTEIFWRRKNKRFIQIAMVWVVSLPDIEGFCALILRISWVKVHGPLHTVLGTMFLGVVSAITLDLILRKWFATSLNTDEFAIICISPLLFHLLLDTIMHPDIQLWWPFELSTNPYASTDGALLSTLIGFFSLVLFFPITIIKKWKSNLNEEVGQTLQ